MAFDTTNLGPLTTTFTPPSTLQCGSTLVASNHFNTAPWIQRGPIMQGDQMSCMPENYNGGPGFYYSPAICPYGFIYANPSLVPTTSTPAESWAWTATCCLSGYTARSDLSENDPNLCATAITAPLTITSADYAEYDPTVDPPTFMSTTSTTLTYGQSIVARGIIVLKDGNGPDWPVVPPISSLPKSTNTAGWSESGLNSGAKAGIGVGVVLGVSLVVGGVYAAYRVGKGKREQRLREQDGPTSRPHSSQTRVEKAVAPSGSTSAQEIGNEDSRWVELESNLQSNELESPREVAELSAH